MILQPAIQSKEDLIIFKYRQQQKQDGMNTLIFYNNTRKCQTAQNGIDKLSNKMAKMRMDQFVLCLKKIQPNKVPQLQNVFFKTTNLTLQEKTYIWNDLISRVCTNIFPDNIKVCQIQDAWVAYKPTKKKCKAMQIQQYFYDYYYLTKAVIDEDQNYHQIQKPKQISELFQNQFQVQVLSQSNSNKQQEQFSYEQDQSQQYEQQYIDYHIGQHYDY